MSISRTEKLASSISTILGSKLVDQTIDLNELTIVLESQDLLEITKILRDHPDLAFDMLIDLCGVDYSAYTNTAFAGNARRSRRFAVVYHLLSIKHNHRLRVRVYVNDDDLPMIDSVIDSWPSANWFEREAFDLYGIVFINHPDLRRILTDYGFIGTRFVKIFRYLVMLKCDMILTRNE